MNTIINLLLELCLFACVLVGVLFTMKRAPKQIGRQHPFIPVMDPNHHWVAQFIDWTAYWAFLAMMFFNLFVLVLLYTEGSARGGGTVLVMIVSMIAVGAFAIGPICGLFVTYISTVLVSIWPPSAWKEIPTIQEFWNMFWDVDNGYV